MRILFLSPHFPWPLTSGGVTRSHYVLRELSQENEVDLVALAPEEDRVDRSALDFVDGCRVYRYRISRGATILRMIRHGLPYRVARHWCPALQAAGIDWALYDVIWVNFMNMGHFVPGEAVGSQTLVLDQHNSDELVWRSFAERGNLAVRVVGRLNLALLKLWQRDEFDRYDVVIEVSERDADVVRQKTSTRVVVLPNGVDTAKFAPAENMEEKSKLLFCGSLDRIRNVNAVSVAAEEILPQVRRSVPDVTLMVVGRNPTRAVRRLAERPGVELHADVPDVVPYYEQAAVGVVPTRMGGGTKLKIFESLSMGIPVVTFHGHGLAHTAGIVESGSVGEFAQRVIELIEDNSLRVRLGKEGRRNAVENYEWSRLVSQFEVSLQERVE